MKKITYHKEGDYLIPDLIMKNSCEDYHIGKYSKLRLIILKNINTELMIKGTLSKHLSDIEQSDTERVNTIIRKIAESENINEDLKSNNQLE